MKKFFLDWWCVILAILIVLSCLLCSCEKCHECTTFSEVTVGSALPQNITYRQTICGEAHNSIDTVIQGNVTTISKTICD